MTELPKTYTEGIDKINKTVEEACKKAGHEEVYVIFSVYNLEGKEMKPNYNFQAIPVYGKYTIKDQGNFWDREDYVPFEREVDSPNWLQLAVVANEMIVSVKDSHHAYLEGISLNDDGTFHFIMGS